MTKDHSHDIVDALNAAAAAGYFDGCDRAGRGDYRPPSVSELVERLIDRPFYADLDLIDWTWDGAKPVFRCVICPTRWDARD